MFLNIKVFMSTVLFGAEFYANPSYARDYFVLFCLNMYNRNISILGSETVSPCSPGSPVPGHPTATVPAGSPPPELAGSAGLSLPPISPPPMASASSGPKLFR